MIFLYLSFWHSFIVERVRETTPDGPNTRERGIDAAVWTLKTVHSGDVKRLFKRLLGRERGGAAGVSQPPLDQWKSFKSPKLEEDNKKGRSGLSSTWDLMVQL